MTGWLLTLKTEIEDDFDASSLTQILTQETVKQVSLLALKSPRIGRSISLGELFEIKQLPDDKQVVIRGDLSRLHRLASGWRSAALHVEGNVGNEFAASLHSGKIDVVGNAGDALATQMRGGEIRVSGNAGDRVGTPLPGKRSGMSGGRVVIHGDTGHSLGFRLRRGTILVHGQSGEGAGRDMVAGTIVLGGKTGLHLGAGMKRGTIVVAGEATLDTNRFTEPRSVSLGIASLLANDLQRDSRLLADALRSNFLRALGDLTARGKGEVWLLADRK